MKKRIIIIENDLNFLKELHAFFHSTGDYEIVGSASDGNAGIKLIENLNPEMLILGLIMPSSDGLSVLEQLSCRQDIVKMVISAISSEDIIAKATALGADYYLLKPLSLPNLKILMDELFMPKPETAMIPVLPNKKYIDEKITNIFITIGIPAHIIGFHFLREAVKIAMGDYKMVCHITKELYPKVAACFNTDPNNVERGIRHAIEVAWNKGKITNINAVFGLRIYDIHDKPTNGELIALLANKIHFENICI